MNIVCSDVRRRSICVRLSEAVFGGEIAFETSLNSAFSPYLLAYTPSMAFGVTVQERAGELTP
jgi:hypothetical protein